MGASFSTNPVYDLDGGASAAARAYEARDLEALDARLAAARPGILVVRAPDGPTAHAVREHLVRYLRAAHGAAPIVAGTRPGSPLWHEVLLQLHGRALPGRTQDPVAFVDQLLAIARTACSPAYAPSQPAGAGPAPARLVSVVAELPGAVTWDRAVVVELASRAHELLVVFVRRSDADAGDGEVEFASEPFDVGRKLAAPSRERWWASVAGAAADATCDLPLADLEAWWARARRSGRRSGDGELARPLSDAEGRALLTLSLWGRPCHRTDLAALGVDASALAALGEDGLVRETAGWSTLSGADDDGALAAAGDPDQALVQAVADRLAWLAASAVQAAGDPWALTRTAELRLLTGEYAAADAAIDRALARVEDASARGELVARWASAIADVAPADRVTLQRSAAERALAVGEADEAHRWARAAAAQSPEDVGVTLLLGRSLVALGDLVAAEVTLTRGAASAIDGALKALFAAELAEVAYLKGDMGAAQRCASDALRLGEGATPACEAVAKARNTLGKLLLADARWDEADRHFAEDALLAAGRGDTTAELRARLNRGIAFLSNGALDEARSIFEAVRAEGERVGDFRASAFALDNLAVVATWRHEYADALALSERTLKLRRRLGDRLTTARIVGNLAELRRKLGLLEHAEHAIAFGRRALGPGMPPERSAHFSFVAARVALDRGHTEVAHREIARAIRDAELAGHRKILAEAHRVSARIALEDGDLGRARAALHASRELAATDEARAESALLEAHVARAAGEDATELARAALSLARVVGEEEGLLDAHLLVAETSRAAGNLDAASAHVAQAAALRDQVASGLPADVAAAFLARRDVAQVARLERQLARAFETEPETGSGPDVASATSSAPPAAGSRPGSGAAGASGAQAELVGVDPVMRSLVSTIKKVARSSSTVLIRGESGTGKELVAAALHRASDRARGPMVTVNCAALVETLLLSELFGHEKGAFTGATARRRGRFELAEGGTLFLDEIGDISPKTQVALLRVLQERTFERVGGAAPIRVDVHVICATHRDLRAMVERGEFREDLYYRLRGITLDVPALRARPGDLPALADHLLGRIASERSEAKKALAPAALELLAAHHWPGNVRELENALRAASLFAETDVIGAADLTDNVDDLRSASDRLRARSRAAGAVGGNERPGVSPSSPPPASPSAGSAPAAGTEEPLEPCEPDEPASDGEAPLPAGEANATAVAYAQVRQGSLSLSDMKRQIERDCIARALAETRGNITRAAALLGMKRPRLSQLVKQYGLSAVTSEAS